MSQIPLSRRAGFSSKGSFGQIDVELSFAQKDVRAKFSQLGVRWFFTKGECTCGAEPLALREPNRYHSPLWNPRGAREFEAASIRCFVGSHLFGCLASRQFDPIRVDVYTTKVACETIGMTAGHFHLTPEDVQVKEENLFTLKIKNIDNRQGFNLGDFGIYIRLEESVTNTVEICVPKKGEYGFRCSRFCCLGHFKMKGILQKQ